MYKMAEEKIWELSKEIVVVVKQIAKDKLLPDGEDINIAGSGLYNAGRTFSVEGITAVKSAVQYLRDNSDVYFRANKDRFINMADYLPDVTPYLPDVTPQVIAELKHDMIDAGVQATDNVLEQLQGRMNVLQQANNAMLADSVLRNAQLEKTQTQLYIALGSLFYTGMIIVRSWWNGLTWEFFTEDPLKLSSKDLKDSSIANIKIYNTSRVDVDGDVRRCKLIFFNTSDLASNPNVNNSNVIILVDEPLIKLDGTIKHASWFSFVRFPWDYLFPSLPEPTQSPNKLPQGTAGPKIAGGDPSGDPSGNPSSSSSSNIIKDEPNDPSPVWISVVNKALLTTCIIAGATWAFGDDLKNWAYDRIKWMIIRTAWDEQISQ